MAQAIQSEILSSNWQEFITFVCSPALGTSLPWFKGKFTAVPTGNLLLVLLSSFVIKEGKEKVKSFWSCEILIDLMSLPVRAFLSFPSIAHWADQWLPRLGCSGIWCISIGMSHLNRCWYLQSDAARGGVLPLTTKLPWIWSKVMRSSLVTPIR